MDDRLYKQIIEKSPIAYAYHKIILDKNSKPIDYEFVEVNQAFEVFTGLKSTAIIGKKISEILPDIKKAKFDWIKVYGDVAINGGTKDLEQYSESLNKYYRVHVYSPEKNYFITQFTDISQEIKNIEEKSTIIAAMNNAVLELDNFFNINLDLLCIADIEGNFLKVNKEWENILGYSKEELEKKKFLEFVHPEDMDRTLEAISKLGKQEQVLNFVNRYKCKDGSYRNIEWRSQPHGSLIYAAARDITERIKRRNSLEKVLSVTEDYLKLYENELDYKKSTNDFLDIVQAKFAAFNLYEEDGKTYTTRAVAGDIGSIEKAGQILGVNIEGKKWLHDPVRAKKIQKGVITRFASLEELIGKVLPEIIIKLIVNTFGLGETVVIKILQGNKMLGDFTLFMPKGEKFQQDNIAELFTRHLGLAIVQKRAEAKLRNSKELLKEAQSIAKLGRWDYIHSTDTLIWTESVFEIFEMDQREGISYQRFIDKVHPEDQKKVNQLWLDSLEKKTNYETTHRLLMKDGRIKWLQESAETVFDTQGKPSKTIGIVQDITARKEAELEHAKLTEEYERVFHGTQDSLFLVKVVDDGIFKYIRTNKAHQKATGITSDIINDKTPQELLGESQGNKMAANYSLCVDRAVPIAYEETLELATGIRIWATILTPVFQQGQVAYIVGSSQDITERKKVEKLLYREKEQFKTTLLSIGDGVISTDNQGKVLVLNKIAEQLTGWTQEEAFGRPLEEVFHIINQLTREKCDNPVYDVLEKGNIIELSKHTILISKNGSEKPIEDSAAPIRDEQGNITGAVLVFRDFTEKYEKQREIEYLSFHDQLTGLYNRRFFDEELKRLDTERNLPLSIVMLDVDGLKMVNDAFGHAAGDKLLIRVADIIKREFRADDIIARIGGDEFVIILPKTDTKQCQTIINRIDSILDKEVLNFINISVSFGCETKKHIGESISDILKRSEEYMYDQKLDKGKRMRYKSIDLMIKTLTKKNKRQEEHSKGVSKLCVAAGISMHLHEDKIEELRFAGLMHDIGGIVIDESILNKKGVLSDSEWREIKRHPEVGYHILKSVDEYALIARYILSHHERWDGKGYPKGLKGEEIPLEARIIAVADAFDAMTSDRSYRKSLSVAAAIEELKEKAGTQFDPDIVKLFVEAGIVSSIE